MMDIGAEISKKIQMAITAKLKELDAYVDDELPDYIMIMVANKKTESQMTEALSLFLSENTTVFTSWLHNLLGTLRRAKSDRKQPDSEILNSDDQEETQSAITRGKYENDELKLTFDSQMKIEAEKKTKSENDATIKVEPIIDTDASQPTEAVITINAESDDILDEELRNDTAVTMSNIKHTDYEMNKASSTESRPTNPIISSQISDAHLAKKTSDKTKERSSKEIANKSGNRSSSHKRKLNNHSRRSPLSSSVHSSKTSKEVRTSSRKISTVNEKDHRKSRRLESDSKQYSSSKTLKKSSVQTVVREWDRGKGEDGEIVSERDKKYSKNRHEEWIDLSDGEESRPRLKGSLSSTVNTVNQEPEFISDNSSGDENIKLSAVTSKISYPERKMRVPLGKQANKALLIKAVSEAEQSVRRKRSMIADEQGKDTAVNNNIRREKYTRHTENLRNENIDKPIQITRRRSGGTDQEGRKFIIHRVSDQPTYPEVRERENKRSNKVILVKKNPIENQDQQTRQKDTFPHMNRSKVISKTSKVILLEEEKDDPVTVIFERKHSKTQNVIYVDGSTSEEEPITHILTRDKRNFIARDLSPKFKVKLDPASPVIKFDSRQAQQDSNSLQEKPSVLKKKKATAKVFPRPQLIQKPKLIKNDIKTSMTSQNQSSNPRFIVTLDGVASKTSNHKTNEDEKVEQVSKNFKFDPVIAPNLKTTTTSLETAFPVKPALSVPIQKPIVIETADTSEDDHEDSSIPTSNTAIGKMREKLLKVQEEAAKLKRMQARLAAAQAQNAILKSGGMYSDKVDEQKSLYIGNVHYSTSEKQLSEYFSICGMVTRVTILKDAYTGHPKGFAYLEFDDKRAVSSALALDNTRLNNRVIRVTLKNNPPLNTELHLKRSPVRGLYPSAGRRFFGGSRFPYSSTQFSAQSLKVPSRNKTWVNPSLSVSKK